MADATLPPPSSPQPPRPSHRVGRFELRALLGRGGMGEVYRAWDPAIQRDVALKTRRRGEPARFVREAQLMASLVHPGIVRVYEADMIGGVAYYACELVEGARELEQAWEGLPLPERVALVRDMARAVGYAHARGIVHRDLKPANVLVDPSGRVRVTDFGVATASDMERLTSTGQLMGTPLYLSPEGWSALDGQRPTIAPQSDVWALGVVLYQALCGGHPFEAENWYQLSAHVLGGEIEPFERDVPPALEAVCLEALAGDPEQRYPDGEALAVALDEALAGRGPERRRRALPILLGGVGVLAVTATLLLLPPATDPEPADSPNGSMAEEPLDPLASTETPDPEEDAPDGGALLEKSRFIPALAAFERRLASDPEDLTARRGRALALHGLGRATEALEAFDALLSEDPQDAELYYRRASLRQVAQPGRWPAPDLDRPVPPHALCWRGQVRHFFGRLHEARDDLEAALARSPDDPQVLSFRADVRFSLGDPRRALDDVNRALELRPRQFTLLVSLLTDRAEANLHLGDLRRAEKDARAALRLDPHGLTAGMLTARLRAQAGAPLPEVVALLDELIERHPLAADPYMSRAILRSQLGDRRGAEADLDRTLELNPTHLSALSTRAVQHLNDNRLEPAARDLEAVLAQNPRHTSSLISLAKVRIRQLAPTAALELLERVETTVPEPTLYLTRAEAHSMLGHTAAAADDFELALRFLPARDPRRRTTASALAALRESGEGGRDAAAWMAEGRDLDARRQPREALQAYNQALLLDPELAEAFYLRGDLRQRLGDVEGAVDDHSRALTCDPELIQAWHGRGRAKRDLGDTEGGIADFQRALALDPGFAPAWNDQALARIRQDDMEGAQSDCDRALELDPDFVDALALRGNIRHLVGDHQGAIEDLTHLLELDDNRPEAHGARGMAHAALGQQEPARLDFRRFLELTPGRDPRRADIEQRLAALD